MTLRDISTEFTCAVGMRRNNVPTSPTDELGYSCELIKLFWETSSCWSRGREEGGFLLSWEVDQVF